MIVLFIHLVMIVIVNRLIFIINCLNKQLCIRAFHLFHHTVDTLHILNSLIIWILFNYDVTLISIWEFYIENHMNCFFHDLPLKISWWLQYSWKSFRFYFGYAKLITTQEMNLIALTIKVFSSWNQCTLLIFYSIVAISWAVTIYEVNTLVSFFKPLCCIKYLFVNPMCL